MKNKAIETAISHLETGRKTCLKLIDGLSHQQLTTIPKGFNNSIFWNVAHLAVTQQLLHYKLSGNPLHISDQMVADFGKGSTPRNDYSEAEWTAVVDQFLALPAQLKVDYENEIFTDFKEYPTSFGVTLNSIEEAIAFNNMHEGLHIGYVMAQKRLV